MHFWLGAKSKDIFCRIGASGKAKKFNADGARLCDAGAAVPVALSVLVALQSGVG
jgi:hypothetical protein